MGRPAVGLRRKHMDRPIGVTTLGSSESHTFDASRGSVTPDARYGCFARDVFI